MQKKRILTVLMISLVSTFVFFRALTIQADTPVGGPIAANTTWTLTNSPYQVTTSVDVWPNVTLTIEPGVVVKFSPGTSLQVNGELIAQGTPTSEIVFTSDTINPSPGYWAGIQFTNSSISTTIDANGNYVSGGRIYDLGEGAEEAKRLSNRPFTQAKRR